MQAELLRADCSIAPAEGLLLAHVEELGGRLHVGHQEMITGTRAPDVEQVGLGGVDLVEFGRIADALDSCLRQHLVIAGGDDHSAKFQPLGEVYRADCDVARRQGYPRTCRRSETASRSDPATARRTPVHPFLWSRSAARRSSVGMIRRAG